MESIPSSLIGSQPETRRSLLLKTCALFSVGLLSHAGLGKRKAEYVGGTWEGVKEGTEGSLNTDHPDKATFLTKAGAFEIPYGQITDLEYGQKAGRRVGATIALGVTTLGVGALPMLFSKKRKHYLSVGWKNGTGQAEGVVLELGKDVTRPVLKVFEVRSGKKVEYESEEAKKHVGN